MESVGDYQYNAKDLIGHGAFAVVFKGTQKTNPAYTVAIKSITKKSLAKSQNLLGKEIKILKELTELQHTNVVALLDCKETQNHVFLVMEYCNGGDLADYLHAKGTLSEDTVRLFLRQIAGAMKALNAKGIVHRDLKPQNILLCHKSIKSNPSPNDIVLKIADFGFARFLNEGVMAATLCGSPMYMAPEVIMSLQYDAKADLWSIGTIVFQCLTGKAPFHAQTPQALKQYYEKNPNLAPKIPSGTSKELTDLLLRLLKRNAKDRMEFDAFFEHPFLKLQLNPTKPVPVPRSQTSNSPLVSPSPPHSPAFYGSPVIMQITTNSPKQTECQETPASSSDEQVDDFVVVPAARNNVSGRYSRTASDESLGAKVNFTTSPALSSVSPEPVPVPTQREAFKRIQRSMAKPNAGVKGVNLNESSSVSIASNMKDERSSSVGSDGSNSRFVTDISQLSPPSVQFIIGTPPRNNASFINSRRTSAPVLNTNASAQTSLGARQLTPPYGTITPVKQPYFCNPGSLPKDNMPVKTEMGSLKWPVRNESFEKFGQANSNKQVFSGPGGRPFSLQEGNQIPYSNAPCVHQFAQQYANIHHVCCCQQNAILPLSAPFASPPHMEEPMTFVAPELPEETLLDRDHNETLAKLNFLLALVDCIIDFAASRGSPLTILSDSTLKEMPNETQRKAEQLVLYLRCLQLISSGLQLSKQEIMVGRLRTSTSVRQVLRTMKGRFHHCLSVCKSLDVGGVLSSEKKDLEGITADKLIYNHAIEMCQSAALEELFGNPEECFRGYQKAQILLHSLSQQATSQDDKQLLNMYKDAVERRLYVLQSQGIVYAYDNTMNI